MNEVDCYKYVCLNDAFRENWFSFLLFSDDMECLRTIIEMYEEKYLDV